MIHVFQLTRHNGEWILSRIKNNGDLKKVKLDKATLRKLLGR